MCLDCSDLSAQASKWFVVSDGEVSIVSLNTFYVWAGNWMPIYLPVRQIVLGVNHCII